MKTPRITVSHLTVLVAVSAVNLAVYRIKYDNQSLFLGIVLMAVALQVALFRLVRGRGTRRMFWTGFLTFGLLAVSSFIWALYHPTTYRVLPNGRMIPLSPEDAIRNLWGGYMKIIFRCFGAKNFYMYVYKGLALVYFLPQLLTALAGGLIARQLAKWLYIRPVREGQTAPSDGEAGR